MATVKNVSPNPLTITLGVIGPVIVLPSAVVTVADDIVASYIAEAGNWQQVGLGSTYQASPGDVVLADATLGAFTVTLPPVAGGGPVWVKKEDGSANAVTVVAFEGPTVLVDGLASYVLAAVNQAAGFISTGSRWAIFGTTANAVTGDPLQSANNLSDVASTSTARVNLGLGTAATQPASSFDPAGAAAAAAAAAMADSDPAGTAAAVGVAALAAVALRLPYLVTQGTAAAAGVLVAGGPNPVDATAGLLAMTLPTPGVVGQILGVEKTDTSLNKVTVSGTIRGTAGTVTLALPNETVVLEAETLTSWRPWAGHKTLSSLDARYGLKAAATENCYYVSRGSTAADTNDGLSVGSAKATIAGAQAALGASPGRISCGYGTFTIPGPDANNNGATLSATGTIFEGLGEALTTIVLGGAAAYTYGIESKAALCTQRNFLIELGAGSTCTYMSGVSNPTSAETCYFESVLASGGTNGFGYGADVVTPDISEGHFVNCRSNSPSNANWILGAGAGNVLNVSLTDCSAEGGAYGVYSNGCNYTWSGTTCQDHSVADFYYTTPGAGAVSITGVRSEGSAAFWATAGGSTMGAVKISDVVFGGQSMTSGTWINHNLSGTLILDNVAIVNPAVTPTPYCGSFGSTPTVLLTRGLAQNIPVATAFTLGANSVAIHQGYIQLETTGTGLVETVVTPFWSSVSLAAAVGAPLIETVVVNATGSVTVPAWAVYADIEGVGGGAGGGGGGAAALTSGVATQVGAAGASAGGWARRTYAVTGGEVLTATIGAGGAGSAGGVASTGATGNAAGGGGAGSNTTVTGTGVSFAAKGGTSVAGPAANSAASVIATGPYTALGPGQGGNAQSNGAFGGITAPGGPSGGCAGLPASATLGGIGGAAGASGLNGTTLTTGSTATATGGNGAAAAANTGCGGGGGGGGAPGGAGGTGGNGGSGYVTVTFRSA